jgi:hypothetical protein
MDLSSAAFAAEPESPLRTKLLSQGRPLAFPHSARRVGVGPSASTYDTGNQHRLCARQESTLSARRQPGDIAADFVGWEIIATDPLPVTTLPPFLKSAAPQVYRLRKAANAS